MKARLGGGMRKKEGSVTGKGVNKRKNKNNPDDLISVSVAKTDAVVEVVAAVVDRHRTSCDS